MFSSFLFYSKDGIIRREQATVVFFSNLRCFTEKNLLLLVRVRETIHIQKNSAHKEKEKYPMRLDNLGADVV